MKQLLCFNYLMFKLCLLSPQTTDNKLSQVEHIVQQLLDSNTHNPKEKMCDCREVNTPADADAWLATHQSIGLYCAVRVGVVQIEGNYEHRGETMNVLRNNASRLCKRWHLHPINGYNKECLTVNQMMWIFKRERE